MRGLGGGQKFPRYGRARSVTFSLRHARLNYGCGSASLLAASIFDHACVTEAFVSILRSAQE